MRFSPFTLSAFYFYYISLKTLSHTELISKCDFSLSEGQVGSLAGSQPGETELLVV